MTIPNKYQVQETAIATFSFSEFASGLGFIKFFLADTKDSVGADFILTEQTPNAETGTLATTGGMDVDFDLSPFNKSIRIKGVASINLFTSFGTAGGTNDFNYTVKIRKWDGTTETEIASASTGVRSVAPSSSGQVQQLLQITIPGTPFSKGDNLRITIDAAINGGSFTLKIDPSDNGTSPSNSNINMPFATNL